MCPLKGLKALQESSKVPLAGSSRCPLNGRGCLQPPVKALLTFRIINAPPPYNFMFGRAHARFRDGAWPPLFPILFKEKQNTPGFLCFWILIVKAVIFEDFGPKRKCLIFGLIAFIFIPFREKIHPDICCSILIVKTVISEVFRAQTNIFDFRLAVLKAPQT